jgi:hypothetical protein
MRDPAPSGDERAGQTGISGTGRRFPFWSSRYKMMVKAFGRALFVTLILILMGAGLWYHPIITLIVLLAGWLTFMLYVDPPEKWD